MALDLRPLLISRHGIRPPRSHTVRKAPGAPLQAARPAGACADPPLLGQRAGDPRALRAPGVPGRRRARAGDRRVALRQPSRAAGGGALEAQGAARQPRHPGQARPATWISGARCASGWGRTAREGATKSSLLADSMEAVFGALYLDGGLEAARKAILPMLENAFMERARQAVTDAKTQLQEVAQALGWDLPEYRLTDSVGPGPQQDLRRRMLAGGRARRPGRGAEQEDRGAAGRRRRPGQDAGS